MSPLAAWICWIIGGVIYQVGRVMLGFPPQPQQFFDSVWWTGFALLMVHFGHVRFPAQPIEEK